MALVVTSDAVGAPGLAFPVPVAPMAPEPLIPVVLTPVKLITVIEEVTFWERVALTVTFVNVVGANVRQISAVPRWVLVLLTKTQGSPPPVTLLTVVLVPDEVEMVAATKANNYSFVDFVENAAVATVVLFVD